MIGAPLTDGADENTDGDIDTNDIDRVLAMLGVTP